MASNNGISSLISAFFVFVCIGIGQLFKQFLANSRQGNLCAGVLGAFIFCFTLTTISNMKMAQFGINSKSGLFDCFISLIISIIASALIHRIAITLTILFSGVFLFFLVGISHKYYDLNASVNVGGGGGGSEKRGKKH
ncbi:unnamed protein product [Meloidogyne enterolobii]|uniref:Uncharacterized protein n=2 Tax=Meloidogyne enterolobii TaxID=390850 RepID=A0A6V7TSA4_MELEN|nr:unnamed protein product [Meloidogyne enterolobii]CAD2186576.1 unnamed protein product [Meloidogyne enterolobii]